MLFYYNNPIFYVIYQFHYLKSNGIEQLADGTLRATCSVNNINVDKSMVFHIVDKYELDKTISNSETLNSKKYTNTSWDQFISAFDIAVNINKSATASQSDANTSVSALGADSASFCSTLTMSKPVDIRKSLYLQVFVVINIFGGGENMLYPGSSTAGLTELTPYNQNIKNHVC